MAFSEAGGHVAESQTEEAGTLPRDRGARGPTERSQLTRVVVARALLSPETLSSERQGALGTGRLARNGKGETPRAGGATLPPGAPRTRRDTERRRRTPGEVAGWVEGKGWQEGPCP